jgi:hypothetical protein
MRRVLFVTSLLCSMVGCAAPGPAWVRSGATDAQFAAAASSCQSAAATRFPPMTFGKPGYFSAPDEWCTPTAGGTNCTIIGDGYLPQARSAADTNETPRANAFHACMVAGGWRPAYQAGGEIFMPRARGS